MIDSVQKIDTALFHAGNQGVVNRFFDFLMPVASGPLPWILLGIGLLTFGLIKRNKRDWVLVLCVLACLGISDITASYIFKPFFNRLRPCHLLETFRLVVDSCGGQQGLPSNHSTNAMALAVFLHLTKKKPWTLCFYIVAAIIGFSRIYVGVHFPGDVLTGFLIGALAASAFYLIIRYAQPHAFILSFPDKVGRSDNE